MKLIFGSIIAFILLCLYVYLVRVGIMEVWNCAKAGDVCESVDANAFSAGMSQTLSMIGGLVSALVISELAVTEPGTAPAARMLDPGSSITVKWIVSVLTSVYLLVWIIAGLAAFFVGYLKHPNLLPALTNLGQAWFGLAVAAGYAYFGIKQK